MTKTTIVIVAIVGVGAYLWWRSRQTEEAATLNPTSATLFRNYLNQQKKETAR